MSVSMTGRVRPSNAGKPNDTRITTVSAVLRASADGGFGSWVQLFASTSYTTYFTRVAITPLSSSTPVDIGEDISRALVQLGIGAAGAEVSKSEMVLTGTIYIYGSGSFLNGNASISPWFTAAPGTRVVARIASPGSEQQHKAFFSVIVEQYVDKS